MNFNIKNIINEIKNINGATKIPQNEIQNFNPPRIKYPGYSGMNNIEIKRIWDGAESEVYNNVKEDEIGKALNNIKPIVFDKEGIGSILNECSDYNEHIWGGPYKNGTEAIAWYSSFHISKYWGIYISYSSFLNFASKYNKVLNNPEVALDLAWGALMAHESVHYGVDVACARLEIILNNGIYINSKNIINQKSGYSLDEEMIAEGVLLRFLKSNKKLLNSTSSQGFESFMNFIFHSLRSLPPGYRDAQNAMTMNDYKFHADEYFRRLLSLVGLSHQKMSAVSDLSNLMPLINNRSRFNPGFVDWSQCPIYIVDDSSISHFPKNVLHFIQSVSGISESAKFQKLIYPRYISAWKKTLTLLSNPSYPKNSATLDFKRWPNEDKSNEAIQAWSVRVGGQSTNLRAHLDHKLDTNQWVADRFGNADKMGHHKNKK